ncbi:hypothetical protein PMAYCL1PPCAC_23783, partial [Pristionchus mayeri]
ICMSRARVNSMRNEKKWQRKDSIHTELRCNIDPEILKRNVDAKTFFEDDQVKDNGSIFCKRENFDNLRRVIPTSKFNGIHIKFEDDCPQGGDDVRLCLLKTLGAHDMRSLPCVACCELLPIYDKYPLIDGIFFLTTLLRQGVPSVHLLFDGRPFYIQVLCVACLWSHWECRQCGDESFMGQSLILGTLYTFDVISIPQCCSPLCHDCNSPISVPPQLINYIKMGNYTLIHEGVTCPACGSTRDHLSRKMSHYNISRLDALSSALTVVDTTVSMTSPKLGTDITVDASIS